MTRKECYEFLKTHKECAKIIFETERARYQNLPTNIISAHIYGYKEALEMEPSLWKRIINFFRR